MAIDINKLEEARNTIETAENELRLVVKQYFESNRNLLFELEVKESELPEFIESDRRYWGRHRDLSILDLAKSRAEDRAHSGIRVNINIDNLSIGVEFLAYTVYSSGAIDCNSEDYVWYISWDKYQITCYQLGMYLMNGFDIEGEQDVKFLCKIKKDANAEKNPDAEIEEEVVELNYKAHMRKS